MISEKKDRLPGSSGSSKTEVKRSNRFKLSSESLEIVRMGGFYQHDEPPYHLAQLFNTLAINHQAFCVCQRLLGNNGFTLNDLMTAIKQL